MSQNKSFFTHKSLPNLHIEVNVDGIKVWVSLNIEPSMKKYLSPNNVFKAEKRWIYCLRKEVDNLNFKTLENVYKELLNRSMINCREAKKKVLDKQIENLMCKN